MSNLHRVNVKLQWQKTQPAERTIYLTVRRDGGKGFENSITTKRTVIEMEGECVVVLDVQAIAEQAARMAAYNKSGKSRLLSGLVQAKRVRALERSRKLEPWSKVPEGAEVLKVEAL